VLSPLGLSRLEDAMTTRISDTPRFEELVLYGLLVTIGLIPVAGTVASNVPFGAEATIGLLMLLAGAAGLFVAALRPRHHDRD
jgi:ascorbate-specific PTS system EIIC-type component UlaA